MADELTRCPACENTLRLPPELLGRPVECPKCGHRFTPNAPAGGPAPYPGPHRADGLTAPAVALLITAILTAVANLAGSPSAVLVNQDPAEWDLQVRKQIEVHQKPNAKQEEKDAMEAISKAMTADNLKGWLTPYCGLSWLTGVLTLVGAIAMLTRKAYALAVIGCLAAFFPSPCCPLQGPFGLWGLIALMGSGKSSFR
jgi:hypothetical protein